MLGLSLTVGGEPFSTEQKYFEYLTGKNLGLKM